MVGYFHDFSTQRNLFDGFRCWYSLAFSDSFVFQTNLMSSQSIPQIFRVGLPYLWCGLIELFERQKRPKITFVCPCDNANCTHQNHTQDRFGSTQTVCPGAITRKIPCHRGSEQQSQKLALPATAILTLYPAAGQLSFLLFVWECIPGADQGFWSWGSRVVTSEGT